MKNSLISMAIAAFFITFSVQHIHAQALHDRVLDISFSPQYVWLAVGNGSTTATPQAGAVRRLDKTTGQWTTFTAASIFGSAINGEMFTVCAVSDQEIWVGFRARTPPEPNAGVAVSLDAGQTWTTHTTADGLPSERVVDIANDAVNGDIWIAHAPLDSLVDGLSRTGDGGTSWQTYRTGDDFDEISADGGTLWGAMPKDPTSTGERSIISTSNRGQSFTEIASNTQMGGLARMVTGVFVRGSTVLASADGFFSAYPQYLGDGIAGIAISTNGGSTWTHRSVTGVDNSNIESVTVTANGDLWASSRWEPQDSLWFSSNGGASWTGYGTTEGIPSTSCFTVRVDETNTGHRVVWAGIWDDRSFASFTRGYVWSDDDGITWQSTGAPPNVDPTSAVGSATLYR